ncbi:hypothetical protein IV203_019394 [Nitzschia inconspicua]|uniref:Uncharacterized protein n=1 Tax=Nitzschia inconspicua TaxID=303405 RepID=A0A9K3LZ61_9STRA|nr:hypothetical protein IV203_019394 [Nitzschia inconspicua]
MEHPEEPKTIDDVVGRLFGHEKFKPLMEPPKLEEFKPTSKALLQPFTREDVLIPSVPGARKPQPNLLCHGLERGDPIANKKVHDHIERFRTEGPIALYGTSGAGKTRAALEYLSRNEGVYLVGKKSPLSREPGSQDLEAIFYSLEIAGRGDHEQQQNSISKRNLAWVKKCLLTLLRIRRLVHKRLKAQFGDQLTPYRWLLVQLYPVHFFGIDIFKDALVKCCHEKEIHDNEKMVTEEMKWPIVIDESQVLLNEINTGQFLSDDGKKDRSHFSALVKAFLNIYDMSPTSEMEALSYPIFCGTGMSMYALTEESTSAFAKRKMEVPPPCIEFSPLDENQVVDYLESLLELKNVNDSIKRHLAKWLRGRPRLTATFVEEFLVRHRKPVQDETKGTFSDKEKVLVQAMDRYITDMTDTDENRSDSWCSSGNTAYDVIQKINSLHLNNSTFQQELKTAIFKFAMGEKPTLLKNEVKSLIELGVAALSVKESKGDKFVATIDEPIIVEAGIRFFKLQEIMSSWLLNQETGGQGEGFELAVIPAMRNKIQDLLEEKFQDGNFDSYSVSLKSCYGVIAKSCKGAIGDTIAWIESATSAKFEGTVPPFCLPDDQFGPDVICLMWDAGHTKFRPLLAQAKFSVCVAQCEALRTLVPDWLYHQNRKDDTKRMKSDKVDSDRWDQWCNVRDKLVGQQCVRLLIQYPSLASKSSNSGFCHRNSIDLCTENKCSERHDWLFTIDLKYAESFFGDDLASVLEYLKPQNKRQRTF